MKNSKRLSIDERVLKWTKRHKKRNTIYTSIILIAAVVTVSIHHDITKKHIQLRR
ncbi:poly-gamma-glutamate synthesis protein PgsA [Staphylococcus gallinarum]|uniref:Poly-gamma-glutamate synthesis protein PgsA n=1 Tax=Staphylococcus gallinarum TaxID=1293 RepID=A0A380FNS5_STAGA|nr:poly-gamma-glutamate synthesis protein PgsA [Staphylococcus gallinarum]